MPYYKVFMRNGGCVNCKGGYSLEERDSPREPDDVFGESVEIDKEEYENIRDNHYRNVQKVRGK